MKIALVNMVVSKKELLDVSGYEVLLNFQEE